MKRPILILALLIMTGAIGVTGYVWLNIPQHLETRLRQTMNEAGFENYTLPPAEKKLGQTVYQNIALDPDGFSTLENLTITYNPLKLALLGKINSLRLSGLDLTGELDPQGKITIAGWNDVQSPFHKYLNLKTRS